MNDSLKAAFISSPVGLGTLSFTADKKKKILNLHMLLFSLTDLSVFNF